MNKAAEKTSQQVESLFLTPMRAYTLAALDYYERLANAQLDAVHAYSGMALDQARVWLDVKDAEGFKKAMDSQQKTASNLMERMKGDSEKVASLGQSFMDESKKMVEENTKKAVQTAS